MLWAQSVVFAQGVHDLSDDDNLCACKPLKAVVVCQSLSINNSTLHVCVCHGAVVGPCAQSAGVEVKRAQVQLVASSSSCRSSCCALTADNYLCGQNCTCTRLTHIYRVLKFAFLSTHTSC